MCEQACRYWQIHNLIKEDVPNTDVSCLAVRAGGEEEAREPAECARVCSCERNPETQPNVLLATAREKGQRNTANVGSTQVPTVCSYKENHP